MSLEGGEVILNEKSLTPEEIVKGLKSSDILLKTTSARAARMLSVEEETTISMMVDAGVIKPLVEALDRDDCSDLQFEASWALAHIASGTHEHTMAVVDGGAIPRLVSLIPKGSNVGEHSVWCLGNIAADGAAARDSVLKAGVLPALLPLLNPPSGAAIGSSNAHGLLEMAVWTYSNLCKHENPLVKFEMVAPALPYISELLEFEDQDVLAGACEALSYLTDGPNDRIEGVQQTDMLLMRLVRLLDHRADAVKTPALRTVVNMLSGSDEQTDRCLDAGCVDKLATLLRSATPSLVIQAALAASNILAGTPAQIDRALRPPERMLVPLVNALQFKQQNPPIFMMVDAGVIKPLVEALDRDDCSDLQFEASWALANIASGTHEHTMAVVDGGAIPRLVSLIPKGSNVGEHSVRCLGNIAADGAAARDSVLKAGVLPALLPLLNPPSGAAIGSSNAHGLLEMAVWTYSNLCKHENPLVKFEMVAPALPYISELLEFEDQDVLAGACEALSYLTDGPNDRIEGVQQTDMLLMRLVRLLDHRADAVKTPALRTVVNMLSGSDEQTDRCLDAGCVDKLATLLRSATPSLVIQAALAASNILAGTPAQIDRALRPPERMLVPLVNALNASDPNCQNQAACAITNLCIRGSAEQLDILVSTGALEPYTALLSARDHRAVAVLDGIIHLLQAASRCGQVAVLCQELEEIGALDKLEDLQHHENEQIYEKLSIIGNYLS